MIQLKWFRIETGADGSILSCQEVEAKGRSGAVVRYYESASAGEACKAAKEWFTHRQATQKARRQRFKDSGMCECGCGGPARPGKTTCQARGARLAQFAKERRAGRPLLRLRHATAEDSLDAFRAGHVSSVRRRGGSIGCNLRMCLNRLDKVGPEAFRSWLVSEINKRSDAAHQIPTEEAQAAE